MIEITPLTFLTYLAIVLIVGIGASLLSQTLKISNVLLLILSGMLLAGFFPFDFPPLFLTSTAILALAMIVFDSSSRFKLKEFNLFTVPTLKLTVIFTILNLLILSIIFMLIVPFTTIWLALLFAALMSGTDPASVMIMFKDAKSKFIEFLEIESIINTPVNVLLPFIILDLMRSLSGGGVITGVLSKILPFLQQIITGIGAGILIGIIVFKVMRNRYSDTLSPIAMIASALLAYILAENLGGNGVIAVTILGVFFGSIYVKEKAHLSEFSSLFANALEILVFVLIGLVVSVPLTAEFFIKSSLLFAAYLIIRGISVWVSLKGEGFSWKDKIFMSLHVQKGIAVAVVVLTLSTLAISGIQPVLHYSVAFFIYSIILSTIVVRVTPQRLTKAANDEKQSASQKDKENKEKETKK